MRCWLLPNSTLSHLYPFPVTITRSLASISIPLSISTTLTVPFYIATPIVRGALDEQIGLVRVPFHHVRIECNPHRHKSQSWGRITLGLSEARRRRRHIHRRSSRDSGSSSASTMRHVSTPSLISLRSNP